MTVEWLDRKAIRARAEAATPGPWKLGSANWFKDSPEGIHWIVQSFDKAADVWVTPKPWDEEDEENEEDEAIQAVTNSTFIAHARTDLPTLLDATDALAGALREAMERCWHREWETRTNKCSACDVALALLDRLGYGAGEGEG